MTAASFYEIYEWVVDDRSGRHVFIGETDTITDLARRVPGGGPWSGCSSPPAGGLFLAAWALTRYTSRRLAYRFEHELVKDAL